MVEVTVTYGRETGVLDDAVTADANHTADVLLGLNEDADGQEPRRELNIQSFAIAAMQRVPEERLDNNQLFTAYNYIQSADTAGQQRERLANSLQAFHVLDKAGSPAMTADLIAESIKTASPEIYDEAGIQDLSRDGAMLDYFGAIGAPGNHEIDFGPRDKVYLANDEDGQVVQVVYEHRRKSSVVADVIFTGLAFTPVAPVSYMYFGMRGIEAAKEGNWAQAAMYIGGAVAGGANWMASPAGAGLSGSLNVSAAGATQVAQGARIVTGGVGVAQGIEHDDLTGAALGGLGMAGGAAGLTGQDGLVTNLNTAHNAVEFAQAADDGDVLGMIGSAGGMAQSELITPAGSATREWAGHVAQGAQLGMGIRDKNPEQIVNAAGYEVVTLTEDAGPTSASATADSGTTQQSAAPETADLASMEAVEPEDSGVSGSPPANGKTGAGHVNDQRLNDSVNTYFTTGPDLPEADEDDGWLSVDADANPYPLISDPASTSLPDFDLPDTGQPDTDIPASIVTASEDAIPELDLTADASFQGNGEWGAAEVSSQDGVDSLTSNNPALAGVALSSNVIAAGRGAGTFASESLAVLGRAGGPLAAASLMLYPTDTGGGEVKHELPEYPGLRLSRHSDETMARFEHWDGEQWQPTNVTTTMIFDANGNAVDFQALDPEEADRLFGATGFPGKPPELEENGGFQEAEDSGLGALPFPSIDPDGLQVLEHPPSEVDPVLVMDSQNGDDMGIGATNKPKFGPGSDAHRAERWEEYKNNSDNAGWSKERWDKQYDVNMRQAGKSHEAVDSYRKRNDLTKENGWETEKTLTDLNGNKRRLDAVTRFRSF